MSFANRFKKMKDQWDKDKPAGGTSRHPDGSFQGKIAKAQLAEGKTGKRKGHLLVMFVIKGLTGESQGNTAFITIDLEFQHESFSGLSQLKGALEVLNIKFPKNLTEKALKSALSEAVECVVDYSAVTKGRFQNFYMNRLVNAAGEGPDDIDDDELEEDETEEIEEEEETEEEEEEEEEDEDDLDLEDKEDEEEEEEEPAPPPKKKAGRPKGSKNKKKGKKKGKKKPKAGDSTEDGEAWDDSW